MPVVVYSALRIALLLVIWGVLVLCHVSGLVAFAIAVVLALLVSYLVFRGPRDRAARYLQERAQRSGKKETRISAAVDADEAAEDAAVDAAAVDATVDAAEGERQGDQPVPHPAPRTDD